MARYLMQTKVADHEPEGYKQFLWDYDPRLAQKPNVREITEQEANILKSGGKLPISVPVQGLKPGFMMMQVPQVLATKINEIINLWEESQTIVLPETKNFQQVEMEAPKVKQPEIEITQVVVDPAKKERVKSISDNAGPEPGEGTRSQSIEETRVNRMKSVNSVETYAKMEFNMDLDRTAMSLDQMKEAVLAQVKQRQKEQETT